jgi:hypothetical protein
MSGATPATLLVSLLPRGESFGASGLLALDAATLRPLAYRELPAAEYLHDPLLAAPPVEHCRGIAQAGSRIYAALFNAVREYTVADARALVLHPRRLLTDRRAVDLHGIDVAADRLLAASTGSDAVLAWQLADGQPAEPAPTPLDDDQRFPHVRAQREGHADWRACVRGRLHLNDVAATEDGLVVCSLTRVWQTAEGSWRLLAEDGGARFHDGRTAPDGTLLLTDAGHGTLIALAPDRARRTLKLSNSARWFVRGLTIEGDHAIVLRSAVLTTRQRDPSRRERVVRRRGATIGLTVVDLERWRIVEQRDLSLPDVAAGVVAYKLLRWQDVPAHGRARKPRTRVHSGRRGGSRVRSSAARDV